MGGMCADISSRRMRDEAGAFAEMAESGTKLA